MLKFGTLLLLALSGYSDAFGTGDSSRRSFLANVGTTAAGAAGIVVATSTSMPSPVLAASPEILKTENGIKYAITKATSTGNIPQQGDIVAIEYTGYLSNGQVSLTLPVVPTTGNILFSLSLLMIS